LAYTYRNLLSSSVSSKHIVACLGLISDTHIPLRCLALPNVLGEIFKDVDLILHAGDISQLSVLDDLSAIAPVIAVQGNDESAQVKDILPLQQVVSVSNQRILLCHSHHPDVSTELSMRAEDEWLSKLQYRIQLAQNAEATVVVFGHTHVPMVYEHEGVTLINPGALASASAFTRQRQRTIAVLLIMDDRSSRVVHIDVDMPQQPFLTHVDWKAGFRLALYHYSESIIEPGLRLRWQAFETYMRRLTASADDAWIYQEIYTALLRIAHECWANRQQYIRRNDVLTVLDELSSCGHIPAQVIADLRSYLG